MIKNINKIVGQRIRELRNEQDVSQEKLANRLGISRATLVEIEAGRRPLNVPEAQTLSEIFGLPMGGIISADPKITVQIEKETIDKEKGNTPSMRISVPQKKINKFREVLLYILGKVGAKANVGETVIYKLLYFIDFDYYEKYEEQIVGVTYIKNTLGPTPVEFKAIIDEMIQHNEIVRVKDSYFNYPQRKYIPKRDADLSLLSATEIKHIDGIIDKLSGMSGKEISEYSHKDVPWITAEEGKPIDYETVFYRTPEYSAREYSEDEND